MPFHSFSFLMTQSPYLHIVKVAIPIPVNHLFDYLLTDNSLTVQPGARVLVPFGRNKKIGFVVNSANHEVKPNFGLKSIIKVLDHPALISHDDFQFLSWASRYYHYPLGEVFATAFPVALRKGKTVQYSQTKYYQLSDRGKCLNPQQLKRSPKQKQLFELFMTEKQALSTQYLNQYDKNWRSAANALVHKQLLTIVYDLPSPPVNTEPPLSANNQQQQAINQLIQQLNHFSVTLLAGITGSGKTEVYMQVIQQVLEGGKQVIVLLPEITLTPQLEARFRRRFSVQLSLSHSRLTESQRHTAWMSMQQGHSAILLGTRSALFTPLQKPGLIILDEEHDSSFKQQQGFRFSARDLAIMRGKFLDIPVILGSATPSLESLHNVEKRRYQLLTLSERAGQASQPEFLLLDIRNQSLMNGLSKPLIKRIQQTLAKKEQVLLFLNRRGYAPVLICHSCSWVARCLHCETSLVIHYDDNILRCHHCGHQQSLLHCCPDCQATSLDSLGIGTEKVEKGLHQLFPNHSVCRLDRDSTKTKGSLEENLRQINQGEIDIILGTQMLAKGHHFPQVTLVALLDVDSGLFSIDFHAIEKLAQLIIQVAGRSGRAEKSGQVILQTRQPHHPLLTILLKEDYLSFAKNALAERQQAQLPPFSFQALIRVYAKTEDSSVLFLQQVGGLIQQLSFDNLQVLGPVPAPMAKRAGYYHFQLLLQHSQRRSLQALLDQLVPQLYAIKLTQKIRWSIDIDPIDLY